MFPSYFCQFLSCASCILFCYLPGWLCSRPITSRPCPSLLYDYLPRPASHCLTSLCASVVRLPHLLCRLILACLTYQRFSSSAVCFLVPDVLPVFFDPASARPLGFVRLSWTDYPRIEPFLIKLSSLRSASCVLHPTSVRS